MHGKKKAPEEEPKTHQQLLKDVVQQKGSGKLVGKQLGCSQQSVSEWMRGSWLPRVKMQQKMKKLYGIPTPWALPVRSDP